MSRLSQISDQNNKESEKDLSSRLHKIKQQIIKDDPEPQINLRKSNKQTSEYEDVPQKNRAVRSSGTSGRKKNNPPEKKKKTVLKLILVLLILLLIAMFIYLPQFLMKEKSGQAYSVLVNENSISYANAVLKQNPNSDFDQDGINNTDESLKNTDPFHDDTDSDGVSDYAEIYITKTNPIVFEDTLRNNAIQKDKSEGRTLSSSYRIGNVLLWADDYNSRAYGSVVSTRKGFQFCNFDGYAYFPSHEGWCAYAVTERGHTLLPYRPAEQAWEIHSDNVELFPDKQEPAIYLQVFDKKWYLPENFVTKILAAILPEKGFIISYPCLRLDAEPVIDEIVLSEIVKPDYNKEDTSRFTKNMHNLNDLLFVRSCIDDQRCVAVSLYNDKAGEFIGVIYGYSDKELFVADPETLTHIGSIKIGERAKMFMDQSGTTLSREYFVFQGFGFSSANHSRINFFTYSEPVTTSSQKEKTEKEKSQMEEELEKASKEAAEKEQADKEKEKEQEKETETKTMEPETQASTEPATEASNPVPVYTPAPEPVYVPPVYIPPVVIEQPETQPAPTVPDNNGVTIIG